MKRRASWRDDEDNIEAHASAPHESEVQDEEEAEGLEDLVNSFFSSSVVTEEDAATTCSPNATSWTLPDDLIVDRKKKKKKLRWQAAKALQKPPAGPAEEVELEPGLEEESFDNELAFLMGGSELKDRDVRKADAIEFRSMPYVC